MIRSIAGIRPNCDINLMTPLISLPGSGFPIPRSNSISVLAAVFTTAERNWSSRVAVSGSRRKPDLISRTCRISTDKETTLPPISGLFETRGGGRWLTGPESSLPTRHAREAHQPPSYCRFLTRKPERPQTPVPAFPAKNPLVAAACRVSRRFWWGGGRLS